MTSGRGRVPVRTLALALVALIAVTLAMLPLRARLDKAHVALLYLLVVLGGSAAAGRIVGIALGSAAFLLFDVLFLPPYHTLRLADPLDWLVLVTFLVTSIVAAELLDRQRRQTMLASARARELDQLATLGAETLNAARAEQALSGIAEVIRQVVGVERCELFVREDEHGTLKPIAGSADDAGPRRGASDPTEVLQYVAETGRIVVEHEDGTIHVAREEAQDRAAHGLSLPCLAFAIPLTARGQTVGALRMSARTTFTLSPDRSRVLFALAYYAALGLYRLRLERAEEAAEVLRRADRLKDALLAAVSHDLRTPLTTIKGIAHEIGRNGQPRAHVIEEEVDRLSSLVDGLLELSQLEAGALPVKAELDTIDDLVGAALQRAEAVLRSHPVELDLGDDQLLVGRFDFGHSLRILVNVLENAAKYSPATAPIGIEAGRRGAIIEIAVSDRGPGIPSSERERIFEPFYRLPGAIPDVRGAGLGLSIARRLAVAQGGDLTVRSRDGGGCVFVFQLPAAEPPAT